MESWSVKETVSAAGQTIQIYECLEFVRRAEYVNTSIKNDNCQFSSKDEVSTINEETNVDIHVDTGTLYLIYAISFY